MTQVIIGTQSALNRYPNPNFQFFMFLPIAKISAKVLYNFYKIVNLTKYQTNYLPPNLSHSGSWLVSCLQASMGHTNHQLPTFFLQNQGVFVLNVQSIFILVSSHFV